MPKTHFFLIRNDVKKNFTFTNLVQLTNDGKLSNTTKLMLLKLSDIAHASHISDLIK